MIEIRPSITSARSLQENLASTLISTNAPTIQAHQSTLISLENQNNSTGCFECVKQVFNSCLASIVGFFDYASLRIKLFIYTISEVYYSIAYACSHAHEISSDSSDELITEIYRQMMHRQTQFRASVQQRVEIGPQAGLDPRLNILHLGPAQMRMEEIPEPPNEDINQLLTFFNQMSTVDQQSPLYLNPQLLQDEDTPANFDQLRIGMQNFLDWIIHNRHPQSELIKKYLQHICYFFAQPETSQEAKISCLLGLARAGHRSCPTRMMGESEANYYRMANAIQPVTFPEQISRILHNVRLGILEEMSGGDVHRRGELLLSIGPQLGIQLSQVSYNDDPALMVDLAPRYAFPVFFRTYTAQKVIDVIKDAINGFPIPNRPLWERAGREISTETVAQWFRENIPDDFSPLLPRDERVAEYLQHIMDQQTNTIKEEAIVAMLVKMQVFNR